MSASRLAAKTIADVSVAGNFGFTIMSEPLNAAKQLDVLTYGLSLAHHVSRDMELLGEVNGRWSTRPGTAPIGTESRRIARRPLRERRSTV